MNSLEKRILKLEKKAVAFGLSNSMPGTSIDRIITSKGARWSLGIGGLNSPKTYFQGKSINSVVRKAETALSLMRKK